MFDPILILLVIMIIIMSTLELVRLSLSIPSVTYRKWIFGRASLLDQSPADNDNDDHGADHDDHVHDEDGGGDGVDDLCMRPTGRQGITVPKPPVSDHSWFRHEVIPGPNTPSPPPDMSFTQQGILLPLSVFVLVIVSLSLSLSLQLTIHDITEYYMNLCNATLGALGPI